MRARGSGRLYGSEWVDCQSFWSSNGDVRFSVYALALNWATYGCGKLLGLSRAARALNSAFENWHLVQTTAVDIRQQVSARMVQNEVSNSFSSLYLGIPWQLPPHMRHWIRGGKGVRSYVCLPRTKVHKSTFIQHSLNRQS